MHRPQVMANRKTATQMLAEACGKPYDEVLQDSSRTFYLSPDEAVEYGLIDKARILATSIVFWFCPTSVPQE